MDASLIAADSALDTSRSPPPAAAVRRGHRRSVTPGRLDTCTDARQGSRRELSGLAEGGINQSAADAAHAEDDEELVAAASSASKSPAKAGRR